MVVSGLLGPRAKFMAWLPNMRNGKKTKHFFKLTTFESRFMHGSYDKITMCPILDWWDVSWIHHSQHKTMGSTGRPTVPPKYYRKKILFVKLLGIYAHMNFLIFVFSSFSTPTALQQRSKAPTTSTRCNG